MPELPRRQAIPADEVGVYQCFNSCVQQAHYCGVDPVTENDYLHCQVWIRNKIRKLAPSFALDLLKVNLMDDPCICWSTLVPILSSVGMIAK